MEKLEGLRRTKFEIIKDFLEILKLKRKSGIRRTRLQQETGLCYAGFLEYFNILIDSKLIEVINKRVFITELGEDYLEKFQNLIVKFNNLKMEFKLNVDNIHYK